jgi:hypothetical protein
MYNKFGIKLILIIFNIESLIYNLIDYYLIYNFNFNFCVKFFKNRGNFKVN